MGGPYIMSDLTPEHRAMIFLNWFHTDQDIARGKDILKKKPECILRMNNNPGSVYNWLLAEKSTGFIIREFASIQIAKDWCETYQLPYTIAE